MSLCIVVIRLRVESKGISAIRLYFLSSTDLSEPCFFAAASIVGWSAHRLEELKNVDKIIRPAYKPLAPYRDYIKLDDR